VKQASDPQTNLFTEPLLSGLAFAERFVTPSEEAELIAGIDRQTLSPFRFQGWLAKRLTTSFGWAYDFTNRGFAPAPPMPDWLEPLRTRAEAFAGLEPGALEQALLIRYDPGAGIGWHRDRSVFGHVVGISLGAPATLRFRLRSDRGFQRTSLPLVPRSIYHLKGPARHDWEHSIAPGHKTRWAITFRSLSGRGSGSLTASSSLAR
jgi:alkylated DNA repair protein (DNA oxidative demethylase)